MNRLLTRRLYVEVATFTVVMQGLAVLATMSVVAMGPTSMLTAMALFFVAVFTTGMIVAYAHVIRLDIDHHVEAAQKPILRIVDERNERIAVLIREAEGRRMR